ncbi:MAG: prepilin-type N-terminal cleavage/methylation domain-containing protein [Armatimonadetes bacterium]|nr:prepilin-type N-terminal cleavage/methylation domain-containing protein [Armatimonadota bacterium]
MRALRRRNAGGARNQTHSRASAHVGIQHEHGFTLIELLVVIAIIAILAAILFPVFTSAKERARVATCLTQARQVGTAVRMYVDDNNSSWPIFQMYCTTTPHKGVEVQVLPYAKSQGIFECPDDTGGPNGGQNIESYAKKFGSSYRFTKGCFSIVNQPGNPDNSTQNDAQVNKPHHIIRDAEFEFPSETRIMRDEMMPWAGPKEDPTGTRYWYVPDWYRQWHPGGATVIFADGHAQFVTSSTSFDSERVSPNGVFSRDGYGHGYD